MSIVKSLNSFLVRLRGFPLQEQVLDVVSTTISLKR